MQASLLPPSLPSHPFTTLAWDFPKHREALRVGLHFFILFFLLCFAVLDVLSCKESAMWRCPSLMG